MSLTEPIILVTYVFVQFILGPVLIEGGSDLLTGDSARKCDTPCGLCSAGGGEVSSYFLILLLAARIIVIVWHALTSRFSGKNKKMEPYLQLLITAAVTVVCQYTQQQGAYVCHSHLNKLLDGFLCLGDSLQRDFHLNLDWIIATCMYIPLYMVFFYFGPSALQTMYSLGLKGSRVLGFLGFCLYMGLSIMSIHYSIRPSFTWSTTPVLSTVSACTTTLALLVFFMGLPSSIDFQLPGPVLLTAYIFQDKFLNYVFFLGLRVHGLQLLPSLPDLLWTVGEVPHRIFFGVPSMNPPPNLPMSVAVGLFQLIAFLVPTVLYMWCIKWVYTGASLAGKVMISGCDRMNRHRKTLYAQN